MKKVKVLVLKTAGTNNDIETAQGFNLAGASSEIVHINRFLRKEKKISEYKILAIPGGFSYGDDISAGKVFANKLKYKLKAEIIKFAKTGKLIIGICNGFQVLVKSGLLPFVTDRQSVTLGWNDSGKFECRWVYLKKNQKSKIKNQNFWIRNLPEIIQLPIAHAEGKFYADNEIIEKLEKQGLVVFKYCDETGNSAEYPYNPNGSIDNIAGIMNPDGNILGLMPHPERFVTKYQYPVWTRNKTIEPVGLAIFKNVVEYARTKI
ncbi:MAG: phosphoribosylformylglycinamidine synthase I [Elusimicrobiota bacterium]